MISRFVHGVPRVQDKTLQQLESGGFGLRTYIAYGIDPRCLWTVFVVCPSMGLSELAAATKFSLEPENTLDHSVCERGKGVSISCS